MRKILGGINNKEIGMNLDDIFIKAEVKKPKKGTGLASALQLIKDLNEFQAKVEECVEAQDLAENKEKIQAFVNEITKMYDVLFEIAKAGVKSIKEEAPVEEAPVEETPIPEPTRINTDDLKGIAKPSPVLNVPQIPKM